MQQETIKKKIKALSQNAHKQDKKQKLLYMILLLQNKEFSRVTDFFEKEVADKNDFYIQMAHIQALVAQKKYDLVVSPLGRLAKKQKAYPIHARGAFYAGLSLLKMAGEPEQAKGGFMQAVESDPTFESPYLYLCELARNNEEALEWGAKGLSLVQPDSEIAKKFRTLIVESLK